MRTSLFNSFAVAPAMKAVARSCRLSSGIFAISLAKRSCTMLPVAPDSASFPPKEAAIPLPRARKRVILILPSAHLFRSTGVLALSCIRWEKSPISWFRRREKVSTNSFCSLTSSLEKIRSRAFSVFSVLRRTLLSASLSPARTMTVPGAIALCVVVEALSLIVMPGIGVMVNVLCGRSSLFSILYFVVVVSPVSKLLAL